MPHIENFSNLVNIKETIVNPNGWQPNIIIEYGTTIEMSPQCFWRVKGTTHTFVIPIIRLDYISAGDYSTHFTLVLETFREDYIKWKEEGFITQWSQEYKNQFSKYII